MQLKFQIILFLLASISANAETLHDVSRLESVEVSQITVVQSIADIQAVVQEAAQKNKKISIAGARHSQGGHIFYPDALVLDMRKFNHVLSLDKKSKVLTVESGATWEDVQNYANDNGLAVKVMQASNIFTVGGSLSVNAHGRDPRFGSMVETIEGFRLLTADGSIKKVNRKDNPELFQLTIGGFGLFGVVLDIDLSLTDNQVYRKKTAVIPWQDYPKYFLNEVKKNKNIELHFAWPAISPGKLLDEILIADYETTSERNDKIFDLQEEQYISLNRFFLKISRESNWGKSLRWFLQKNLIGKHGSLSARNNAMRPEVKFLDYHSEKDTDILQEYFFPIEAYEPFMLGLKKIVQDEHVNLLSMTLRYVPSAKEPFLHYTSDHDSFAAVLYINQGLAEAEKKIAASWTQHLVDLALSLKGNYYLPYQRYPTREQIRRAYPNLEEFFRLKKKYDPNELFINQFYQYYK